MSYLIERLREVGTDCDWNGVDGGIVKDPLLHEAADTIERLTAELAEERRRHEENLKRFSGLEHERDRLHAAVRGCLTMLRNGAAATETASVEFLQLAPAEVELVVSKLTAERDAAKRDSARVLAMYHALRDRLQAAMQETIEEQPR